MRSTWSATPRATLRALIPMLAPKADRSWRRGHRGERRPLVGGDGRGGRGRGRPGQPDAAVPRAVERLPENAIVAADSGSSANWYARQLKFRGDVRGSLSGTLATMGPGVPYGIGAKFAHPDRPAIVFAGDGAMQMNGLAELITIKHYWQQWADPRLIIAVLHNNDLNQVTWEMRAMEGAPKFTESQTLPDVDYAAFAASLGLHRHARRQARGGRPGMGPGAGRRTGRPCWTCAPTRASRRSRRTPPSSRPRTPPQALLKGDENRRSVIVEGMKTKVQEFLPGRGQS